MRKEKERNDEHKKNHLEIKDNLVLSIRLIM